MPLYEMLGGRNVLSWTTKINKKHKICVKELQDKDDYIREMFDSIKAFRLSFGCGKIN
jgi:hypothetical protein